MMKGLVLRATTLLLIVFPALCDIGGRIPSSNSLLSRGGSRAAAAAAVVKNPDNNDDDANNKEIAVPLSQSGSIDLNRDAPLLNDIQLLSQVLSEIVQSESQTVHDLYEQFREYGLERADPTKNSQQALEKMVALAAQLNAEDAVGVVRTFSVMLNLVNSAEVHHRTRQMRAHESVRDTQGGPLPLVEDSVRGTMDALLESGLATKEQIYQQLLKQKVEIVLTAHPTQVQRKSMLRKYSHIADQLATLERPDLSAFEKAHIKMDLQRTIASILGADEIRRLKPTPQQEATGGNAIVESVLWDAVPAYLRKLDAQVQLTLGMRLPIDFVPVKFASWIGGDRDGNPNVTPLVTREVVLQQHLRAARLFMKDMYDLLGELNISTRFSPQLLELAGSIKQSYHNREKYRRVVGHLIKRLVKTAKQCELDLAELTTGGHLVGHTVVDDLSDGWTDVEPIKCDEDLMVPLRIMYDSLVSTGYGLVADGKLVDIIRRVASFGMSFLPLDIREESGRHTEALDAITRHLGIGSYAEWNEEARVSWLTSELASKRPLFLIRDVETLCFEPNVVKTLQTIETASELSPSSLGAYVISQAQTASDVLAVMLLQKQFGMTAEKGNFMRVVPLFETLNDLTNAADVLKTLFSIPVYVGAIRGKQEVMVGYSDSAKDAGRLAACWAQYKSQEEMVQVGDQAGIELTFFHGKGGTVSRYVTLEMILWSDAFHDYVCLIHLFTL
jgi:phosphoenolpyruvate carboxylase